MDNPDWGQIAIIVGVIVPSIILHEVSHGVAALLFGDDTAKRAGRLTLNPIAHVDPFGTLILPAMLAFSGFTVFGYAKPVPVNVRRLRNQRQHTLYVSLAGPLTNLLIAALAAVVLRALDAVITVGDQFAIDDSLLVRILFFAGLMNVLLALFNLLPIPPLDGSAVLERLLPAKWLPTYYRIRPYSMLVLLVLFLAVPGFSSVIIDPALWVWRQLL